jgi:hypothetical protein
VLAFEMISSTFMIKENASTLRNLIVAHRNEKATLYRKVRRESRKQLAVFVRFHYLTTITKKRRRRKNWGKKEKKNFFFVN